MQLPNVCHYTFPSSSFDHLQYAKTEGEGLVNLTICANVISVLCLYVWMCATRDYILDMMEGGRKLIVFGHHKVVLDAICESLENKVLNPLSHSNYIPRHVLLEWHGFCLYVVEHGTIHTQNDFHCFFWPKIFRWTCVWLPNFLLTASGIICRSIYSQTLFLIS